jgi:hypothetical protein
MSTTLTITLPADLAARLFATLPPEELNAFAVVALAGALDQEAQETEGLARDAAGLEHVRPLVEYPDRAAYLANAHAKAEEHRGDPDLLTRTAGLRWGAGATL